jgi:hypothetical protein
MAHHKRRKPRTKVRCTMCTDGRAGNAPSKVWGRFPNRQRKRYFDWRKEVPTG